MAIRFEYSPGATGGLAAYAAGSGRRRQRELKYAVDLAQRGQERRDRFNLIGQQQNFAREMELGRNRWEALREVGRETARLGERKYAADLALDRDEMVAKRAAEKLKLEDVAAVRKRAESAAGSLDIPSWVSPSDKVELEKEKATIKAFLKPDMDFADPGVQKTFNERLERFYARVGSMKPPSPSDEIKGSIVYRDPAGGGFFDEDRPGAIPYQRKSSGEWVPLESPEQKAGEEYRSKVTAIADKLEKEVDETSDEPKPVYKTREEALDAAAKKVAADDKFFGGGGALAVGHPKATPNAAQNPQQLNLEQRMDLQLLAEQAAQATAAPATAQPSRPAGFDAFLGSLKPQRLNSQPAQTQATQLPPGAVQLPDGTVRYEGIIYRRRTQ